MKINYMLLSKQKCQKKVTWVRLSDMIFQHMLVKSKIKRNMEVEEKLMLMVIFMKVLMKMGLGMDMEL